MAEYVQYRSRLSKQGGERGVPLSICLQLAGPWRIIFPIQHNTDGVSVTPSSTQLADSIQIWTS